MPDILIRGMETPGSCAACDFYNVISGRCTRTGTKINFSELTTRSVDCPILELPPHGDLVDRSELQNTVMQVITKFPTDNIAAIQHLDLVNALLRGATVIVPAEKGETQ